MHADNGVRFSAVWESGFNPAFFPAWETASGGILFFWQDRKDMAIGDALRHSGALFCALFRRIENAHTGLLKKLHPPIRGTYIGNNNVQCAAEAARSPPKEILSNFVPSSARMRCLAARSMDCSVCAWNSLESVIPARAGSMPLQDMTTLSTWNARSICCVWSPMRAREIPP